MSMHGIEVGMICIKTAGRSAGQKVVVVEEPKKGVVLIDGLRVKRKPYNIRHLFVTNRKVEIKKGASHAEIVNALSNEAK